MSGAKAQEATQEPGRATWLCVQQPEKGRYRLTNDPARGRRAAWYGSLPQGRETNSYGANAVSTREGNEARTKAQGQS